jgi:hypothetical protein
MWFRKGDMKAEPIVCLVTKMNKFGVGSLSAFSPNAIEPDIIDGARHHADPYVKSHLPAIQEDGRGTWDYVELEKDFMDKANSKDREKRIADDKKRLEAKPEPEANPTVLTDPLPGLDVNAMDVDEIIVQARTAGHNAALVAAALSQKTGNDWNYQKVNARWQALTNTENK